MENPFAMMSDDELMQCYVIYRDELHKLGICNSEPLRGILTNCCYHHPTTGILVCELFLLQTIAPRWESFKNLLNNLLTRGISVPRQNLQGVWN